MELEDLTKLSPQALRKFVEEECRKRHLEFIGLTASYISEDKQLTRNKPGKSSEDYDFFIRIPEYDPKTRQRVPKIFNLYAKPKTLTP